MIKGKAKADKNAARAAANTLAVPPEEPSASPSRAETPSAQFAAGDDESAPAVFTAASDLSDHHLSSVHIAQPMSNGSANGSAETVTDRTTLLRLHEDVMNRFITLMVPILVDVYAASVSVPIRIKSLASLLKAIAFQDEEQLKHSLKVRALQSKSNAV